MDRGANLKTEVKKKRSTPKFKKIGGDLFSCFTSVLRFALLPHYLWPLFYTFQNKVQRNFKVLQFCQIKIKKQKIFRNKLVYNKEKLIMVKITRNLCHNENIFMVIFETAVKGESYVTQFKVGLSHFKKIILFASLKVL